MGWWNAFKAKTAFVLMLGAVGVWPTRAAQPLVAIHDSELTRALESMPAAVSTPSGTGFEWWPTNWHYFVMPESVKEALRSDGTAFEVVSDADILAGRLLDANGQPRYPILISLASEAVSDAEIAPLTNYVAAGGFLLAGSSAFTRNPDGTTRGDFAFANAMGAHSAIASLQNWTNNLTFSKPVDHRLISHIPGGVLTWDMPTAADEVSEGISPGYVPAAGQRVWRVQPSDALVIAQGFDPLSVGEAVWEGQFFKYRQWAAYQSRRWPVWDRVCIPRVRPRRPGCRRISVSSQWYPPPRTPQSLSTCLSMEHLGRSTAVKKGGRASGPAPDFFKILSRTAFRISLPSSSGQPAAINRDRVPVHIIRCR
jgi:hypothetical protein